MSQDTGAELNGRFTALQISGENILSQTGAQTELIGLLNTNVGDIRVDLWDMRNIADEVRTIQVNSYLELQEIRQNTGSIIKPIQKNSARYRRGKDEYEKFNNALIWKH